MNNHPTEVELKDGDTGLAQNGSDEEDNCHIQENLPHIEPVSWDSLGALEPMNVETAAPSSSKAKLAGFSATALDGVRSLAGWWKSPQVDNSGSEKSIGGALGSSLALRSSSSSRGRAALTSVMLMLMLAVFSLGLGVEIDSLGVLTQAWVSAGSWLQGQSRLRRLVSTASARARRSGVLQPLPLAKNGLEEVHDDATGVYFLVNHVAKKQSSSFSASNQRASSSSTSSPKSASSALSAAASTGSRSRAWLDPAQDPLSLTSRERDLEVCGPKRGDACVLTPRGYGSSSSSSSRGSRSRSGSRSSSSSSSGSVVGGRWLGASVDEKAEAMQGWSVVLNKFAGLQDHVLIVTDVFREQSDPLNGNDLAALATLVLELPGVGFFNSGSNAGASQRHRHLQAVPLDVLETLTLQAAEHARGGRPSGVWAAWHRFTHGADHPQGVFAAPPIAQLFEKYVKEGSLGDVGTVEELPFRHAFVSLDLKNPSTRRPQALDALFAGMASICGLNLRSSSPGDAYNFLLAPTWALLVPRSQRVFAQPGYGDDGAVAIDVNALGFLGCFLVQAPGVPLPAAPSEILENVAFPRP